MVVTIFICIPVKGKDTAMVVSLHRAVAVTYDFNRASKNFNSNEIVKELAGDAVKNVRSTRVSLDFSINVLRETNAEGNTKIKLSFFNPLIGGDNHFRGFKISDVLLPDKGEFEFLVSTGADSSFTSGFRQENFPVTWSETVFRECDYTVFDQSVDSIQLTSIFLYYDEASLDRFHERVRMIHEYYASSAMMDSLLILANSMDLQKEKLYPEYFVIIEEINKAVEVIGRMNLPVALNLETYDPRDFRRKYSDLFKLSKSVTMTFEERLEKADTIHSVASADSVVSFFISGIIRYINWALLVNDRNGNIYNEYLDNYYNLHAFGDDLSVLKKLLGKINPGENPDTLLSHVFQKVLQAYDESSGALMKGNHYAEAIELIEHAKRFSAFNPYTGNVKFDESAQNEAANGIFASYLGVAEGSIKNRKFEMAENYLAKARAYRLNKFFSVKSDSLYKAVFMRLVQDKMTDCESLAKDSRFEESLDCLRYLEAGYDSCSLAMIHVPLAAIKELAYSGLCSEMLSNAKKYRHSGNSDSALILFDLATGYLKKISNPSGLKIIIDSLTPGFDQLRYSQLIIKAGNHNQGREYSRAYREMQRAMAISEKYHFSVDPGYDSLWKLVYPHYLQYLLMISEKMIWSNQLPDAVNFADSVAAIQASTGFGDDTELTASVGKYRKRIGEKICMNAKEEKEIYELRAQHYLENKNFLKADILLDSALKVDSKVSSCHLSTVSILGIQEKYREAIFFQHSMAQVEILVSVGGFDTALRNYQRAESYFKDNKVSRFGITCEPLFDYLERKSSIRLTYAAAMMYLEKMDYLKTLDLLKMYRLQGGAANDVKNIQKSDGIGLSAADFVIKPGEDPSILVNEYTGNNKWFINFERAYISHWNFLRKSSQANKSNSK